MLRAHYEHHRAKFATNVSNNRSIYSKYANIIVTTSGGVVRRGVNAVSCERSIVVKEDLAHGNHGRYRRSIVYFGVLAPAVGSAV